MAASQFSLPPGVGYGGCVSIPSPTGGGLGWGRLPDFCKVVNTHDFTLTPTLSLKGEGEIKAPAAARCQRTCHRARDWVD